MDTFTKFEKKMQRAVKRQQRAVRDVARSMFENVDPILAECNCEGFMDLRYDMGGPYYRLTIYPKSDDHSIEQAINFFTRIARHFDLWLAVNEHKQLKAVSQDLDRDLKIAQAKLAARQPIIYRG